MCATVTLSYIYTTVAGITRIDIVTCNRKKPTCHPLQHQYSSYAYNNLPFLVLYLKWGSDSKCMGVKIGFVFATCHVLTYVFLKYRIAGNFRGVKISLNLNRGEFRE